VLRRLDTLLFAGIYQPTVIRWGPIEQGGDTMALVQRHVSMQRVRPFWCNQTFRHDDGCPRPAATNWGSVLASRNASRSHWTSPDACHVSCNSNFNKAGQEGTLSRPDRPKVIQAVFSKRAGDQDVALTERASRLRRRLLIKTADWI